MSDGRLLHVISGDQGFLPAPVSLKQLSLAPGERREILVDMTNGDEVIHYLRRSGEHRRPYPRFF
ncbi:cell division protein [Klebsiella pneumoniae]|uniref:Cell division protein n=1 Tax=Klebsiella pneumoniae TaxID=573 RepID=A0A447RRR2_KLEPN|nr:cell division protein [Klebsiella pneumoniae]